MASFLNTTHDESLNARSFLYYVDGRLVSYVGVVHKTIKHGGQLFYIAGLSCVATDPEYHGQGFGLRTVAAATRWIEEHGNTGIGIFTCKPSLAYFYERAGAWQVAPEVKLIASCDEGALSSDSLQVVVLIRLFSTKARNYDPMLRHTTIDLDLPVGEFL
ncbi:GNAT family N-acetyltransferase [Paenibacillus glucanolyticus]|uniref:GNAT family N-acetyltransferase n=1 Tax=Paenibacillus glucanolyticus TaxID=59843 RepID=UPI000B191280|nr:GNAT family N-acetyltransferase [Paenibacillus glucanolyticus]